MDREKVISGLQRCRLMNKVNCDKCPYDYNGRGDGKSECTAELATDALAMLKEQETEIKRRDKPVCPEIEGGGAAWFFVCGACHGVIDKPDKFCKHCGTAVCWTV